MATDRIALDQIPALRRQVRKQRRQLSFHQQQFAEHAVIQRLLRLAEVQHAQKIGLYLSDFGEISTQKLIYALRKRQKQIYIPMICNMNQQLVWTELRLNHLRSQRLARHRLGMHQIMANRAKDISMLDVVIMPLVLFDGLGHRVGMGGGFYDRTLSKHPHRPIRLGLAHDFQQVGGILATQPWDQSLDFVCTPTTLFRF